MASTLLGSCPHCGKKIPMQAYDDGNGETIYGAKKSNKTIHVTRIVGGGKRCFDEPKTRGARRSSRRTSRSSRAPHAASTATPGSSFAVRRDRLLLSDNSQYTNRFEIKSQSSDAIYTVAQSKTGRWWACSCLGWIRHKKCKHLDALGLPGKHRPYEAALGPAR